VPKYCRVIPGGSGGLASVAGWGSERVARRTVITYGQARRAKRPAASGRRRVDLALGPLRGLASLLQARLLALDHACVTGEEALAFQRHAQLGIALDERARHTVPDGARLAGGPTAVDADTDVVRALSLGHLERRDD